jgi:hemerythrin-like domain-containing protein
MPFATDNLRRDHDRILRVLDHVDACARRAAAGEGVSPAELLEVLEFLRVFADEHHHAKEEQLLFPALVAHGLPAHGGPVAVMLHDHDLLRALVREMAEHTAGADAGRDGATLRWAKAARHYTQLLREHIFKENEVLFRMAERILPREVHESLSAKMAEVESQVLSGGLRERFESFSEDPRHAAAV